MTPGNNPSRNSSILALALEGSNLQGVVLRRGKGAFQAAHAFNASLSLDPLTADADLVGREIRNCLEKAGVNENRCVVGVPLNWALTLQVKLPEIPDAEVAAFLNIQAERGFPYAPEDLMVSTSRYRSPEGQRYATLVAVPRNHSASLEKVLRAAKLKPLSFSLAMPALQPPNHEGIPGLIALRVGETSIDLQVTCGGGVAVLRTLQSVWEGQGAEKQIDTDLLNREMRLTLGQLPGEFRESISKLRLFGRPDWVNRLAGDIAPSAKRAGLQVEVRSVDQADGLSGALTASADGSPALALGARYLISGAGDFEFLPPRVSAWKQATARLTSRKVGSVGATAGSLAFVVVVVFLAQSWKLSGLESRWREMSPRVAEISAMQQNIRKFRPWFDESIRSLTILEKLTEAFPVEGVVSVKSVEIKGLSEVTCSGVAQDQAAIMKVFDMLQKFSQVQDLKLEHIQGKSPLQFSLKYRWAEEGNQ